MEPGEVVEFIKARIIEVRSQGHSSVSIEWLLNNIDGLGNAVKADGGSEFSLERFRMGFQAELSKFDKTHEAKMEDYRQILAAGQAAMRAAVLINGGAAVALLAFIGHLVASSQGSIIAGFASALLCYVFAVLCGGVSFGFTYLTLSSSFNAGKNIWSRISDYCSVAFVVASWVLFICGSCVAYKSFTAL